MQAHAKASSTSCRSLRCLLRGNDIATSQESDASAGCGSNLRLVFSQSPSPTVTVELSRGPTAWPEALPAPDLVRAKAAKPAFTLLAGAKGTASTVAGTEAKPLLQVEFPRLDSQALFSYTY